MLEHSLGLGVSVESVDLGNGVLGREAPPLLAVEGEVGAEACEQLLQMVFEFDEVFEVDEELGGAGGRPRGARTSGRRLSLPHCRCRLTVVQIVVRALVRESSRLGSLFAD